MPFTFSEKSPAKILLKWFESQEKKQFTIQDVLDADIEVNISQRRQSLWQLIDNGNLDLSNDLKIIVKESD